MMDNGDENWSTVLLPVSVKPTLYPLKFVLLNIVCVKQRLDGISVLRSMLHWFGGGICEANHLQAVRMLQVSGSSYISYNCT